MSCATATLADGNATASPANACNSKRCYRADPDVTYMLSNVTLSVFQAAQGRLVADNDAYVQKFRQSPAIPESPGLRLKAKYTRCFGR
jgi:hypothetical protein